METEAKLKPQSESRSRFQRRPCLGWHCSWPKAVSYGVVVGLLCLNLGLLSQALAQALPQSLTLQGRLLDPSDSPVESASVDFYVRIFSPSLCLLYEETHNLNMSNSDGVFSLGLGAGGRNSGRGNFEDLSSLAAILDNSSALNGISFCEGGETSYTPTPGAGRRVQISFDDNQGSGLQTFSQDLNVRSVPYALHSQSLQGRTPENFVEIPDSLPDAQTHFNSLFGTDPIFGYSALQDLLSGAPYAKSDGSGFVPDSPLNLNNQVIENLAQPRAGEDGLKDAVNREYADEHLAGSTIDLSDLEAGKVISWDGSQWVTTTVSGTDDTKLPLAGGTMAGDIDMNNRAIANASTVTATTVSAATVAATATTTDSLTVTGEAIVGQSGMICSAASQGAIRYNTGSAAMEFCNGSTWVLMGSIPCDDLTPDAFAFPPTLNTALSDLVESDIVQITGFNCGITVTVSGPGSPALRICSNSDCSTIVQDWTTNSTVLNEDQYLQLRQTTSHQGGDTRYATALVGSVATAWAATPEGDCTVDSPAIGTVCADGTVYAGLSGTGLPMYTTRCDLGQTWDGVTCTGSATTTSWNNGSTDWFTVPGMSTSDGKSNTNTLVAQEDVGAPYNAATACHNSDAHGKNDWYLPARSELAHLYNHRVQVGGFSSSSYWTSTQEQLANHESRAHLRRFSDGASDSVGKNNTFRLRCVRTAD